MQVRSNSAETREESTSNEFQALPAGDHMGAAASHVLQLGWLTLTPAVARFPVPLDNCTLSFFTIMYPK